MKVHHKIGLAVLSIAVVMIVARTSSKGETTVVPAPLVLEKVQALGQLHTARYTYQTIYEQTTSRQPAEWASYVPGAASFVRTSTENSALVEVHGEVEAGVDLSKAHMTQELGQDPCLILPHAVVYRPNVDTVLHGVRRGYFWRDDNIGLEAEQTARNRFRDAATKQGIIAQAEKNVLPQIAGIISSKVKIRFE